MKDKSATEEKLISDALSWWNTQKIKIESGYSTGVKKGFVVYKTLSKIAKSDLSEQDKEYLNILKSNKIFINEVRDAARSEEKKTHEKVNAIYQAEFIVDAILGKKNNFNKKMQSKAKMTDGTTSTIVDFARDSRMLTVHLATKPRRAEEIKNVDKRVKGEDKKKKVFTGHSGAGYYAKVANNNQVVSSDCSSNGEDSIHSKQILALKKSTHIKTASMRISKVLDAQQENGNNILKAYDEDGFLPKSNWRGFAISSPTNALIAALGAKYTYNLRRTEEKKSRLAYVTPDSASEDYDEISTSSEAEENNFINFVKSYLDFTRYKEFIKRHNIDVNSDEFYKRTEKLGSILAR